MSFDADLGGHQHKPETNTVTPNAKFAENTSPAPKITIQEHWCFDNNACNFNTEDQW
jgi:hypothetical protein